MTNEELRALPLKELIAKIDSLKSSGDKSVNQYESELERRFLAWEACEV